MVTEKRVLGTAVGILDQSPSLLDVDYNRTSAYGHFGKPGLPWEE